MHIHQTLSKAFLLDFFSVIFPLPISHSALVFHFFSIKIGKSHMNWLQEMDTCFISVLKAKIIYYHTHCLLKNYLAKLPATGKKKKKRKNRKALLTLISGSCPVTFSIYCTVTDDEIERTSFSPILWLYAICSI